MKYISLAAVVLLTGCAQVISSNPSQITIKSPPGLAAEAQGKADVHCSQYKKTAVPSTELRGNMTVYRCE